jgi:hypothetical protein
MGKILEALFLVGHANLGEYRAVVCRCVYVYNDCKDEVPVDTSTSTSGHQTGATGFTCADSVVGD